MEKITFVGTFAVKPTTLSRGSTRKIITSYITPTKFIWKKACLSWSLLVGHRPWLQYKRSVSMLVLCYVLPWMGASNSGPWGNREADEPDKSRTEGIHFWLCSDCMNVSSNTYSHSFQPNEWLFMSNFWTFLEMQLWLQYRIWKQKQPLIVIHQKATTFSTKIFKNEFF